MSAASFYISMLLRGAAGFYLCATPVFASAPKLYTEGAYQSPVRADPDDLAVLIGDGLDGGDQVVYQVYSASDGPDMHPDRIPAQSTAETGVATVIAAAAPYQLTIRFPNALIPRRAYQLWVKNPADQWSNGVSVNEVRPLWFSPDKVYSTQSMASLARRIKVIGRNLSPPDPLSLQVRLEGSARYELAFDPGASADPAVRRYVADMQLPRFLSPGTYRVEVRAATGAWITIRGQSLIVLPDPPAPREFLVSDPAFGNCRPDDGQDDTECVAKAIQAARRAGGGTVMFNTGSWDLRPGVIVVPALVDLQGRGAGVPELVRHSAASAPTDAPEIVLLGHNSVRGLNFSDAGVLASGERRHPILQLGARYSTDNQPLSKPAVVSDIEISGNSFIKTAGAIIDGGSPIDHLLITYNHFGDYAIALDLGGNRYNVRSPFRIDDSVIGFNRFMPGSYINLPEHQGVMASELGASRRVDFSSNVADGADRRFLSLPTDAPGWRAGFFWHMNNNNEMLLISDNTITCSGDKAGDGEAISLDNNANTFAFAESRRVVHATPNTISVKGTLQSTQNSRPIDTATYYVDDWLRVDSGPGIGQARKIVSYLIEPRGGVTFSVEPAWDVVPMADRSRVSVGREFWQTFIIGNTIDQRKPLCTKNNGNSPKGGGISIWAQNTDSVVEANKQYDTDGIVFMQSYIAAERSCSTCSENTMIPSFLEIRGNLIDGEYDWDSACSLSGIMGYYGASPTPHSPPPLLNLAVSISHNRITHADGLNGGSIDIVPSGYQGPLGYAKPLVSGLTIDHNDIGDISGPAPKSACNYRQADRIGIHLQGDQRLDSTVLYMNRCDRVKTPVADHAAHTRRVCDSTTAGSCECTR